MENIQPVIILGAKGLGRVALDIFENNQIPVYCFLEDDQSLHNTTIGEITVMGATDDDGFLKLIGKKCSAFVAMDNYKDRQQVVDMLQQRRKVMPVNAIHSLSGISKSASIGHGNLLGAVVWLEAGVSLGHHNILQAGVKIDYATKIADFAHIGTGVTIGPEVEIAENVFIGAGATLVSGIKIGKNARIGVGSVVVQDVPAGQTVFGNPAQKVNQ